MTHLGIEKYVVFAESGGGPIGLQMALKFPQKVKALLLQAAITGDFRHAHYDQTMSDRMKSVTISPSAARLGAFYIKFDPKSTIREMLEYDGKYDANTREEHVERICKDKRMMDSF